MTGPPILPPGDPDALPRLVHEQRLAHEADRAAAEGRTRFNLGTWEERPEYQRELDRRIASAVAAQAVHDAGLRNERLEAQLFALAANLPAVRRALTIAISEATYEAEAKPFRAALQALGISEEEAGDG